MDVTENCNISARQGFDSLALNRFLIIDVNAKYGDLIRVNSIEGIKYSEIWGAYENPKHEDRPIIDEKNKIVVVGGENKESKRRICIVGK